MLAVSRSARGRLLAMLCCATLCAGALGFITPSGEDTAESTDQGQGQPGTTAGGKP